MRPSCIALGLAFASLLVSSPLLAQAGDAPPAAGELVPPELLELVPASVPDDERPERPARVVLELVVAVDGSVGDVRVVESAGALDAHAVEAVQRFRFEPARSAGVPVAVTIRYEYVFEPKPAPPPPEPAATPEPAPATPAPADAVPPAAPPATASEIPEFEGTASVEAPPTEPTRRDLDADTIRRIPGTRGDVLKSVEILPGVSRPTEGGDPILRGAAAHESRTFLNGTPVPFLYHLGGLASFMSPYLVERLEVTPSNFSSRYGRVAGGVIEVRARDPESQRLRAMVDLNMIDTSAFVEFPLGEDAGFAVAGRRSNIDFFFEQVVPEDAYSVVAAPVYWDYQAIGFVDLSPNTRLRLIAHGARDSLELFIDDAGEDPGLQGEVGGLIDFHRVGLELDSRSRTVSAHLGVTVGRTELEQSFGEWGQQIAGPELYGRGELGIELDPSLRLTVGADVWAYFYEGVYRGPVPGNIEGDPREALPLGAARTVTGEDDSIDAVNPGGYVELAYRPFERLLLSPGVRVDYFGAFRHTQVDPRFSARFEATDTTTLKAGVGSYSQVPEFWQAIDVVGNPELDPYRAIQTSAGVEQRLGEEVELGVEGFYKRLTDVAVATPNREEPFYTNDGKGRVVGGELSLEARWPGDGYGFAAYTLSRSERDDGQGDYRLFDSDQTHILSLTTSQGLGAGWEVGLRFRLISGNPTTPITGAIYDARSGVYVPTFGATNSARNPTFHQLDLRVEKGFDLGRLTLTAYADIQNVYNAQNQEGVRHSFDYSERETVTGLPFFPSVGLRGEL